MDMRDELLDAGDAPARQDTLTLQLVKPLKLGEAEFSVIELREPTVGEVMRCTDKGTIFEQMQALISTVGRTPRGALGGLPASAYRRAEAFFMQFLAPGGDAPGEDVGDSLTITFAEPVKVGDVERAGIVVTEPTLSMLNQASKVGSVLSQEVELLALASMPSGGSRALVEAMRFSDFAKGRAFLAGFTAASAPTS